MKNWADMERANRKPGFLLRMKMWEPNKNFNALGEDLGCDRL